MAANWATLTIPAAGRAPAAASRRVIDVALVAGLVHVRLILARALELAARFVGAAGATTGGGAGPGGTGPARLVWRERG